MANVYRIDRRTTRRLLLAAGSAASLGLGGCNWDSYLDPSVTGRWEWTPTSVPVLDRIASIEDQTGEGIDFADPTPADLEPVPQTYRIAAGDRVVVTIFDIITPGRQEEYERQVDLRGNIDVPQLGQIRISGLSLDEARVAIETKVAPLVPDPLVSIVPQTQRQQTFTIIGAVSQPGPYFIPGPDYRLLEAITAGGAFNNNIEFVYVIRQVSLTDTAPGDAGPERVPAAMPGANPNANPVANPVANPAGGPASGPGAKPSTAPDLLDVIDSLGPAKKPADDKKPGQPGLMRSGGSLGSMANPSQTPARPARAAPVSAGAFGSGSDAAPPIDLVEDRPERSKPAGRAVAAPDSSWIFVNGRWQQRAKAAPAGPQKAGETPLPASLSTQRVLRVPLAGLLTGRRDLNIVIRPGDIVRMPQPLEGSVYIGGNVNRGGTYQLPPSGKLSLERAIVSAGGLSATGIPSRVDLTRMTAPDRQAKIRLDLGAIAEGTQPDIFLKPDDYINVGTNFWAYPLAVVRNGIRASYGYGFILDRNFGNDVFGIPPGSVNGQTN